MSNIRALNYNPSRDNQSLSFGQIEDVGNVKIGELEELYDAFPSGFYQAVGSALKRTGQHGMTIGAKAMAEEYVITQKDVKKFTQTKYKIPNNSKYNYASGITFSFRGSPIPLINFDTRVDRNGRVSARVLRSSTRETLDNAFVATMGTGHRGVYERDNSPRLPITEFYGPSAVHALLEHEEAVDKMEASMLTTFNTRIDHEVMRVMNGWGVK